MAHRFALRNSIDNLYTTQSVVYLNVFKDAITYVRIYGN
jgi:hypothetical protein